MLEKNLKLADIMLTVYSSYVDPLNEDLTIQINEYISKMKVLEYLPLNEKRITIFRILNFTDEHNRKPDEVTGQMEILFLLEVINQYTNIEVEETWYELLNEDFFDALETTGIVEAIEEISWKDIEKLHHMLDSTVNWHNIFNLIDGFKNIDMSHVDQLINEVREAKKGLKEENLDLLKKITDYNQPNADTFSNMFNASIINSLDKVSEEEIARWNKEHDFIIDLDNILGEKSYETISKEIIDYFNNNSDFEPVQEQEIRNVYNYLKEKNQDKINKLDYQIAEENRANIEKGMSSQMIKLLSKKKSLEKKYKKEEELLRLADTVMSMDSTTIDEIAEVLEKIKNDKETDTK